MSNGIKERMIMEKQKNDKSWSFLYECTSNQLNLLSEILFINDKKRVSVDLTDGKRNRLERKNDVPEIINALSDKGKCVGYKEYLKHVARILCGKKLQSENVVGYEDAILLACLNQLALEKPKFFKNIYNLAANSDKDVVEELQVRFTTSPAFKTSLPVVLSAIYADSLSLSQASKNVIDERLKVLGVLSSLGTYHISSLAAVYAIGAAFGPMGLAAASVYQLGKMLFSNNMTKDNFMPVACVLIMLRRQSLDTVKDKYSASDVISKLMSDSISVLDKKGIAKQKEQFILSFFMKMLKAKDEDAYRRVVQLFPKVNDSVINVLVKGKNAIIKPLLPYADYLVERFYPLLFQKENIEEYVKYVGNITSKKDGLKSCLIQGFIPSLVSTDSNIHFYVAASDKAKASLCLNLMGQQFSEFCIDSLSENENFCIIIAKDKKFVNAYSSHLLPGGKCFCFIDEKENALLVGENVLVRQLKEENINLKQQLDEYKRKELFWKNATHSFRHSHMTYFIGNIRKSVYCLKKQYNVEQNFQNIDDLLREMSMYVDQFGKDQICLCDIWQLLQDVFGELKSRGILVVWKNVCETKPQIVELMPHFFKEWVLENIRSNIYIHAFPHKERKKCIVWITLREQENSFAIEICNNGEPFKGNQSQIFQKGKFFGGTGHTGLGMYYAKMYMNDIQKEGSIEMMPFSQEYSVGFKILISKK